MWILLLIILLILFLILWAILKVAGDSDKKGGMK